MTTLCTRCHLPMHRYGAPADRDGHTPAWMGCINSMRGERDRAAADAVRMAERISDQHPTTCRKECCAHLPPWCVPCDITWPCPEVQDAQAVIDKWKAKP